MNFNLYFLKILKIKIVLLKSIVRKVKNISPEIYSVIKTIFLYSIQFDNMVFGA